MEQQLSLFEGKEVHVADIRTEKQQNKQISYDVGERIANSRKCLAVLRKQFEELHSVEHLEEIENISEGLAEEVVTKKELIKNFTKDEEQIKGVSPGVYRFKELLLQRIDGKPTNQSKENRAAYMRALQYLLAEYELIFEWSDVKGFIEKVSEYVQHEGRNIQYFDKVIEDYTNRLQDCEKNSDEFKSIQEKIGRYRNLKEKTLRADAMQLSILGNRFVRFFKKHASRNSLIENASKIASWEDLNTHSTSKSTGKSERKTWSRVLPERPDRIGGGQSPVTKPEDMVTFFGFRGIEYGNWVSDQKAFEHLLRSSEAFMDLAELLEVDYKAVSLEGNLAIAYGSRGQGMASAHYEPLNKVINMTKTKGCLGVLSHEWWHSFDHRLFNLSHGSSDRRGFATEYKTLGENIPFELRLAFQELEDFMKKGETIEYFDNTNKAGVRWSGGTFRDVYKRNNGNLFETMKEVVKSEWKTLEFYKNYYKLNHDESRKKAERNIKRSAMALAWYHEELTGEHVDKIPYPSDKSVFYKNSTDLDRGKVGKYYSTTIEMAARSFEAYIQDKLESLGRRSDYLVAGTKDIAYPMGKERELLNQQFEKILQLIRELNLLK